jgi:hypothetical protein
MKVYPVVYVDLGQEDFYSKVFDSEEKAQKFIDELPEEMKNDSGQWIIKEWEVE